MNTAHVSERLIGTRSSFYDSGPLFAGEILVLEMQSCVRYACDCMKRLQNQVWSISNSKGCVSW